MRKPALLLFCLLLASLALAQREDKAILNTYRVLAKPGKDTDLKKALTAHAAKYHKGDLKWRVFQVVSGPEEGTYQINEGLSSWTALEARKNISDEHDRDYETSVLPLIEKTMPAFYMHYEKELSTDSVGGKFKKVLLRHFYMKPGKGPEFKKELTTWKKVFQKMGSRVTVWSSFYSGQPQYDIALRLTQGWTDLDMTAGTDFEKAFDEVNGTGAFAKALDFLNQHVDRIVDEMMEFLPEVSSPELSSR